MLFIQLQLSVYISQNALALHLCLNFMAERKIMKSFLFVWIVFSIAVSFKLSSNCLKAFHGITKNESNLPLCLVKNRVLACL